MLSRINCRESKCGDFLTKLARSCLFVQDRRSGLPIGTTGALDTCRKIHQEMEGRSERIAVTAGFSFPLEKSARWRASIAISSVYGCNDEKDRLRILAIGKFNQCLNSIVVRAENC